jgi:hypothetical protein
LIYINFNVKALISLEKGVLTLIGSAVAVAVVELSLLLR